MTTPLPDKGALVALVRSGTGRWPLSGTSLPSCGFRNRDPEPEGGDQGSAGKSPGTRDPPGQKQQQQLQASLERRLPKTRPQKSSDSFRKENGRTGGARRRHASRRYDPGPDRRDSGPLLFLRGGSLRDPRIGV